MHPPEPDKLAVVTEEDRENISAYLDGELAEEASEMLVAKLGRSHDLRTTAEELKKTWELLDYLPRPQAPENFTEKTLHKLDTTKLLLLTREKRWRWLAAAGWALTLLLAAGFGFAFAFYWPKPQPPTVAQPQETAPELPVDTAKEHNGRLIPPHFPKNVDERVRRNINRILVELRDKATLNEWHKLRQAAQQGTWEFLEELRRLAQKHEVPLEMVPPKSPGKATPEEPRPRPFKGTPRRGGGEAGALNAPLAWPFTAE